MQNTQISESKRHELIAVAESMLLGQTHLLEGTRRVCALRHAVENPEHQVFLPLRAVDSETDHFPLGPAREGCSPEYLKQVDGEMQAYLADAREDILLACRNIVDVFS